MADADTFICPNCRMDIRYNAPERIAECCQAAMAQREPCARCAHAFGLHTAEGCDGDMYTHSVDDVTPCPCLCTCSGYLNQKHVDAMVYHDRACEHNRHVEHGAKVHLVQPIPTLIVMGSCPCGLSYTMTDGKFSSGSKAFFETMEGRDAE